VVARRSRLHTGVMEVPLPECSDEMLTIITNVIALTPGTSPLHLTRRPTVLYIHVLDMRDVASTRRDVQRLADLAFAAFGSAPVPGGGA
jgi:multicomponent Na+:H+ antiporter subunit E